jgi:hypothetical protein
VRELDTAFDATVAKKMINAPRTGGNRFSTTAARLPVFFAVHIELM